MKNDEIYLWLMSEISCRIDHGADSNGHLEGLQKILMEKMHIKDVGEFGYVLDARNCKCGGKSKVVSVRPGIFGLRRRRECIGCGKRFSTFERRPAQIPEYLMLVDVYEVIRKVKEIKGVSSWIT